VAHAGVTDDELEVALPEGDACGVNDADDREDGDGEPPLMESEREKVHRHAQPA